MKFMKEQTWLVWDGFTSIFRILFKVLIEPMFWSVLLGIAFMFSIAFSIVTVMMHLNDPGGDWKVYWDVGPAWSAALIIYVILAISWFIGKVRQYEKEHSSII